MNKWKQLLILVCVFSVWVNVPVAADEGDFSTEPKTNNGKKWRVGYYEGGEYTDYQQSLLAMIEALRELGWLETVEIPAQKGEQTREFWHWLVNNVKSEYIEFVEDGHYTANWDEDLRKKMAAEIITRLNQKKDIDFMIAAGTAAGQDLANDNHQTPTLVISTSDPLSSGIIKSIEDSGYDHVHARVSPDRYERQIRIFHDIIGFQKLGVAYENTPNGRVDAAIDKIEAVSEELGFEIVSCHTNLGENSTDVSLANERVQECFHELGKNADAIYVTLHLGVNAESIPELVEIVNSYHIPTFSQSGSEEVQTGFLLSIAGASFKYVGGFYAETIAKVFNGARPRQLEQLFEGPPKIAINLKTAEIIGYDPPFDVLGAADEIYQEIEEPK
jgi:ABC-type uncharacterized transport system substrate-binding protein